jgi:protein-tyrosine phosphatase
MSLYRRATEGPAFIRDRYGSARGLGRMLLARAGRMLGAYRPFETVRWDEVERLVFVCSGNICRSPYAEARAKFAGFPAVSVALRGESGRPAERAARLAAAEAGLDLGSHVSQALAEAHPRPGDLLIAMEPWQARQLRRDIPHLQVTLLGLWSKPKRPHLHDPYTLSDAYFRTCFRLIDSGVESILARATK